MLQIKLPDVKLASYCFSSISPNIIPANVSSSMVFILSRTGLLVPRGVANMKWL